MQRTSQTIPRKDFQKEMNEEFELITVTISLTATAMNENNCRTATGKPAFSGVMQSMSRHVILPRAFGKEEKEEFHISHDASLHTILSSFRTQCLKKLPNN